MGIAKIKTIIEAKFDYGQDLYVGSLIEIMEALENGLEQFLSNRDCLQPHSLNVDCNEIQPGESSLEVPFVAETTGGWTVKVPLEDGEYLLLGAATTLEEANDKLTTVREKISSVFLKYTTSRETIDEDGSIRPTGIDPRYPSAITDPNTTPDRHGT